LPTSPPTLGLGAGSQSPARSSKRAYYTVPEVARLFGVASRTVRGWVESGALTAKKNRATGRLFVPADQVDAFLDQLQPWTRDGAGSVPRPASIPQVRSRMPKDKPKPAEDAQRAPTTPSPGQLPPSLGAGAPTTPKDAVGDAGGQARPKAPKGALSDADEPADDASAPTLLDAPRRAPPPPNDARRRKASKDAPRRPGKKEGDWATLLDGGDVDEDQDEDDGEEA
jgi:excisionase family DNA binding protein